MPPCSRVIGPSRRRVQASWQAIAHARPARADFLKVLKVDHFAPIPQFIHIKGRNFRGGLFVYI